MHYAKPSKKLLFYLLIYVHIHDYNHTKTLKITDTYSLYID